MRYKCGRDPVPGVAHEADINQYKHPGTAAKMFEALYDRDINIDMIATSEIKISVLIDINDADKAVSAIHKAFFPEE